MKFQVRQLAIAGLLGALVVVLGLTPLGFVPVPTPAGNATTIHIPVILAGVLEGPVVGGVVGLIFGIFSWVRNIVAPTNPVSAMLFSDPLVTFLPRILIGVVSYYAYAAVRDRKGRDIVAALSGLMAFAASFSLWQKTATGAGVGGTLFSIALGLLVATGAFLSQRREQPALAYATATALGAVFGVWVFFGIGLTWLVAWRILAAIAAAVAIGGAFGFAFRGQSTAAGFAAILGTATNTAGVLGIAVMRGYLPAPAAWTVAIVQGLPECFVAAILAVLIERGVRRAIKTTARG